MITTTLHSCRGADGPILDLLLGRLKQLGLVKARRDGSGLTRRMCWRGSGT